MDAKDIALIKALGGGGSGGSIIVDSELSDTSENPVQNRVVKSALDSLSEEKMNKAGWSADKYLGTDSDGNVVEKDAPEGSGGSSVMVDAEMSDTSENPVQNKVVKAYVDSAISGSWTEEY